MTRGRARMPMRGGCRPSLRRQFQPHVPFDMAHCESSFPRVTEKPDDKSLSEALVKRNQDLTPNSTEQATITALVTKLQTVIDALVVAPATFEAAVVEEARPVGSFKKGTMITGTNIADVVIILRTLPTREAVNALGQRVITDLKTHSPKEAMSLVQQEKGFDVVTGDATVKCLISTIPINIKKLEPDLHLPAKLMADHLAAIRHVRWCEENAAHVSIKVLVRLIKDLRQRYSGLNCLSPWLIDLLAHHAIMSNPTRTPLPINRSFRRVLELLSSGIFLPCSIGILDPCELGGGRAHVHIPLEQMDTLSRTAQTLLRVLAHGGYRQILNLEGAADVTSNVTQWGTVIVAPSQPVYVKVETPANGQGTLIGMEGQQAY
ncbi:interleukin enhancer-binding factor 2 homolog [Watersipora subatra]|uniref:interleukin enhancer-binding factor 2 homolog n=1 Tax=Watersipora subatra TaxID=2589382 RepID=UPI00355AF595